MAIADTITSMQNHTSNAYDMLSNGTDLTGINKNLENLSSTIFEAFLEALRNPDTLFNNLPKTSASGSNITLNNTAYAPMRITLNPTALEQTTYTGKNKLDISIVNSTNAVTYNVNDNKVVITSTSANANCYLSYKITNLQPSTQYTISGSAVADNIQQITIRNYKTGGSYTNLLIINKTTINDTFTTTSDFDYLVIFLYSGTGSSSGSVGDKTTFTNLMVSTNSGEYEPYVGGTASPNPSYPQDIHTISGDNTIVVEGKNKYNATTSETTASSVTYSANETIVKVNGARSSEGYINFSYFTLPSGTYTLSMKLTKGSVTGSTTNRFYVTLADSNNTEYVSDFELKSANNFTYSKSFTLSESKSLRFRLYVFTNNTFTNAELSYQVTTGSTSDYDFVPYQEPQTAPINLGDIEYCKIGDYEDKFVRSDGNNLINTTAYNKTSNTAGVISQGGTPANYLSIDDYVSVKPNTTYTISFQQDNGGSLFIATKDSSGTFIERTSLGNVRTFTTGSNVYQVFIYIYKSGGTYTEGGWCQLEYGETATPYTPYEKGWYIKKNIGKVVLDGSEDENWNTGGNNPFYYYSSLSNFVYVGSNQPALCNLFTKGSVGSNNTTLGFFIVNDGNVRFREETMKTLANWKTYLETNNLILYYALETPTYTKITGELANQLEQVNRGMLSYDGVTNISQVNNDLAFVISASALEDLR